MKFRTFIGGWILLLIVGALSLHELAPTQVTKAAAQATKAATPVTKSANIQTTELSSVEKCASMIGILDSSLSGLERFKVCEERRSFEYYQELKRSKIPVVRVIPY